jgi:hypothetical protein
MSYTIDNGFRRSKRIATMNPVHFSKLELLIEDNVNKKYLKTHYNLRKLPKVDYSQYFDNDDTQNHETHNNYVYDTQYKFDIRRSQRIANTNKINYSE